MLSRARIACTAWITAAALLFGALSPALASLLYAGHAQVLAQMLGVPAPAALPDAIICHTDDLGTAPATDQQDQGQTGHGTRGIYCSFCPAAAAVATLPTAELPPVPSLAAHAAPEARGAPRPALAHLAATRLARAPPA